MSNDLMAKVASVQPEIYSFLTKTAAEVRTSPFRDEIVEEMDAIIKHAQGVMDDVASNSPGFLGKAKNFMGGAMKGRLGAGAALLGGAITAGVATHLAGDLYDAARRGLTKSRNYKAMLQANPDLAEEDPELVKAHFNTLHRFNPEFSADPNIAAAYVRSGKSFGHDIGAATSLVQARKNIRDTRALRIPSMSPFPTRGDMEDAELRRQRMRQDVEEGPLRAQKLQDDVETSRLRNQREIATAASDSVMGYPGGAPSIRTRALARGNPKAYPPPKR